MMSRHLQRTVWVVLILLLIGGVMWVLNMLTPEYEDDYWYPYMYADNFFDMARPITSFWDVLVSQYNHYLGYNNGRSVVHTIVQLFAGVLGRPAFFVANAAVFVLFVWLIVRFTLKKMHALNILFGFSVIFLLFPTFNLTVLWMAGAVNYLWTSVFIILFLMAFEHFQHDVFQKRHLLWFLPGIVAGWTHEGIAFPFMLSLLIYVVVYRKTIGRSALLPMIAGFVIGTLLCTFAPSTLGRIDYVSNLQDTDNWFILILLRIYAGIQITRNLKAIWVLLFTLFLMGFVKRGAFWGWLKQFYVDNLVVCNAMILSFGVVFGSGFHFYEVRVGIGVELCAIILWLRIISTLESRAVSVLKIASSTWAIVLCACVVYWSIPNYRDYKNVMAQIKDETTDVIVINTSIYPSYVDSYIVNHIIGFTGDCWGLERHWWMDTLYHCKHKAFVPVMIYNEILLDNECIHDIAKQWWWPCYVIPLEDDAENVLPVFILNPTDFDSLPFYVRPFARGLARYTATEAPSEIYRVVHIEGRKYLIIKKDRYAGRVASIELRPQHPTH